MATSGESAKQGEVPLARLAARPHECAMAAFSLPTGRARTLALAFLALVLLVAGLLAWKTWHDTTADPRVVRTSVVLDDMPTDAGPVTVALISDIHVAGPDMPPERLRRIVAQINALKPDAVLIAGDLVSKKTLATKVYQPHEIVAPLGDLESPLGTFFVPGNHDHWYDLEGLASQLAQRGVTILANEAVEAGPLLIGGLDDDYTGHDDIPKTLAAMDRREGARIFLGHSPDSLPALPEGSVILAGHTHCGQIRLPIIGAIATQSRYGQRFACGRTDEGSRTAIVGAGLGTSVLPIRFGTRPEVWLIDFTPPE